MIGYFQYGVELPWDGSNSLPSMMERDCLVDVEFKLHGTKETGLAGRFNWMMVESYKVIDERYKPAEKDKTWHERGDLPPVGARFEVYFEKDDRPKWDAGVVAHKSIEHTILKFDDGEENHYKTSELKKIGKFRPIRTGREKAIEAACSTVKDGNQHLSSVFGQLYDAGLLRLPEEK